MHAFSLISYSPEELVRRGRAVEPVGAPVPRPVRLWRSTMPLLCSMPVFS